MCCLVCDDLDHAHYTDSSQDRTNRYYSTVVVFDGVLMAYEGTDLEEAEGVVVADDIPHLVLVQLGVDDSFFRGMVLVV